MKKWIREKRSIVIYLILYLILSIILILVLSIKIIPSIKDIEEKKQKTQLIYSNIERISGSWLTLAEFKKNSISWVNNKFIVEILKNIDSKFYEKNLVNLKYPSYSTFIIEKRKELNSKEYRDIIILQSEKISKILPVYSEILTLKGGLTDYKFINHIESLIESFNLTTSNPIGITKINILDDFSIWNKKGDNLGSNIYSIPLSLDLIWTKSGIIDFLYFVENVWKITIKEDAIVINNNSGYLYKNGAPKVLEWDKYIQWKYNIFEHQIMDVSSIKINDYIDNRYTSRRTTLDLKNFILKTQWNDEFEVKVDLNFYIKWQPTYKIKSAISLVIDKHKKAIRLVNSLMKDTNLTNWNRLDLSKENDLLKSINKKIGNIKKNLQKIDTLDAVYKEAMSVDKIIFPVFKKNKYIENVLSSTSATETRITKLLENDTLNQAEVRNLEMKSKLINSLNKELEVLRNKIKIKEKINDSYKRIIEIDFLIDEINISLKK